MLKIDLRLFIKVHGKLDLKTKHAVACELRDMVDTVRDADTPRVMPIVLSVVVDRLKNSEPSGQKDSPEYAFRRVLIEILHRLPTVDTLRARAQVLCAGLLHVIATDYEENAITCCKILADITRTFRPLNEELIAQFFDIMHTIFRNIPQLAEETLSEGSPPLDPNVSLPSTRSFKVFAEIPLLLGAIHQVHRTTVQTVLQQNIQLHLSSVLVQSSAQRKVREDYEAMGGYWCGVAPTMPNVQAFTDLVTAQAKVSIS